MLKLSYFSVSVLIILNVQGFAANSLDNANGMMDLVPQSNSTLQTIHGDQQSKLNSQFLAVQKKLEDQNTHLKFFEARLNETEGQLRMFEGKMEAQLKELQNQSETQLLELKNQQSAFQKTLLETLSTINSKIIDPKFMRIGTRYFYIEHDTGKSWNEAASACRGIGGYLAAFKTEGEVEAIMPHLKQYVWNWTGINDLKKGPWYLSTASGKPATPFRWQDGEPKKGGLCVLLSKWGTSGFDCSETRYFICQSDNET